MANPPMENAEVFLRSEIEALGDALDVPLEGSLDSPSQAECLDCQPLDARVTHHRGDPGVPHEREETFSEATHRPERLSDHRL